MKQRILYGLKISLAVLCVLFSLLMFITLGVYLFTGLTSSEEDYGALLVMTVVSTIAIAYTVYHFKTFYLVSKIPRGETFRFKEVKKVYWSSALVFGSLTGFCILLIFIDGISVGFSFELIDWLLFCVLLALSSLSFVETVALKKIYKQKSIHSTNAIDEIGRS